MLQIVSMDHQELDEYILRKLMEKIHLMYFRGIRLADALAERNLINEERRDGLIAYFTTWKEENRLKIGGEQADMNLELSDLSKFTEIPNREWQDFLKEMRTLSRVATRIVRFSN